MVTKTLSCRKCGSTNLVKNGSNGVGNPKSKCKDCGFSGVIQTKRVDEATKQKIAKAYQKRSRLQEVGRIFNVSYQSVLRWTKKAMKAPSVADTLAKSIENEVLELDELCSFVQKNE